MIRGAALNPVHSNHRAGGGGGTIRAARLALAALLLLGGCASGKAPALGEHEHVVIGYGAGGARTLLLQPVPGGRLSSTFGARRDPFTGKRRAHAGLDFAAPVGAPVRAAGDGVVVSVGPRGGYGHYVRLRHDDSFETAYAHLSRYAERLERGLRVRQGEVIGYVGTSGRSTGPHLHYEILAGGTPVDPFAVGPSIAQATKGRAVAVLRAVGDAYGGLRDTIVTTAGALIGGDGLAEAAVGGPDP